MNKAVNLLQQYISDGQFQKALHECKKLLSNNPKETFLMKLLSHIYFLIEDYQKAVETSLKILELDPNDFDSINNIGSYNVQLENFDEAQRYIKKAKQLNNSHPAPLQNNAEIAMKKREFSNAAQELDLCISFHEKYSDDYFTYKGALILRIEVFIALKEQDKAVEFIKKYLSIKFDGELLLHLVQIKKDEVDDNLIKICKEKSLSKTFNSKLEKYQELVPLYFALANFYEKSDQEISEEYYIRANKEVFEIVRLAMMKFQKSVINIMENFNFIKGTNISDKDKGHKNIFIVGMPRSGTTLTESMITANSEVFAGGELQSFYDLANRFILNKDFSLTKMNEVGDDYVYKTEYFLGEFSKVVDKLPNNYLFLGHIRKFLPRSKVILILRDPWDVAVSLFKQRYVTNIPYASSMFNIGVTLANFEASILFWQKQNVVDENIFTIKYEDLVKNFDEYQNKLYEFCEIKAAYEPEKRERFFAKTATIYQVQNKIHTESVKKEEFLSLKSEFVDAFNSQREFWNSKNLYPPPNSFFGYKV